MALPETGSDWIEWKGGECPVPAGTRVDVKFRSGEVAENQVAWGAGSSAEDYADDNITPVGSHAGSAFWQHDSKAHPKDIVAYRVVEADSANDGWCVWVEGLIQPAPETRVEVRLRCGEIVEGLARAFFWHHDGDSADIIAYRIVQPDAAPEPAANAEANILREAEDIIYGDREATYGHPAKNLESIARFWTGYLKQKYGIEAPLTPEDVCWMMALLKMSRQMNSHKRDNLVDAAGYLALIERVQGAVE